mmetsp:Transcript_78924/g.178305  ORF Transcript_78924/g.178305 Transcript_78924/m.178305 type:complete len:107 (-) Transcript_78924:186-506(-)
MSGPSHMDLSCREALKTLLRPDIHHAIAAWMAQANETEKRSIIRMARAAEPGLLDHISKPRKAGNVPAVADMVPGHWTRATKKAPVTLLSAGQGIMSKSMSSPAFH